MPLLEPNPHRHCRKNGSRRKQPEPGLERPGQILQEPQAEREEKATEAARGPHEAGSHPHLLGKSGRDDLKDRPVAESHCGVSVDNFGTELRRNSRRSHSASASVRNPSPRPTSMTARSIVPPLAATQTSAVP